MMNPAMIRTLTFGLLAVLFSAGCIGKTQSAKYYTLRPINKIETLASTASMDDLAVGIGPVKFPDELDRNAIVTSSGPTQLQVNEFHRWGGSLENNIIRVLQENLSLLLQTNRVMSRPWEGYFNPDIRVALDIRQFDGRLGKYASLNATWTLINPDTASHIHTQRTFIQQDVSDNSYDALVEAQSLALAELCREIAVVISEIHGRQKK
jgi:hypothetical protein